jgi:lipid II:glycine glycyltransferase (peptidoglycan interpeptide bridge formation enzyme)
MWSGCSNSYIKTAGEHGKFVDVFLKLSTHIPLMYTKNHDVANGIANETLCHLVKVVLHLDVTENNFTKMNIDGYYVHTIDATKVNYLLCKIKGSNQTFEVWADHVSCKKNLPIKLILGENTQKIVHATIIQSGWSVITYKSTNGRSIPNTTLGF